MHGEQVEGHQQGCALARAEGHTQHSHQAWPAAAPNLMEGEREKYRQLQEAEVVVVIDHSYMAMVNGHFIFRNVSCVGRYLHG